MGAKTGLASSQLSDEHKVILRMLAVVEKACDRLESGKNIPAKTFTDCIDFIRIFADKCHHGKEEDTLFPLLGKRGFPTDSGPIAVMLIEHVEGRKFVKGLDDAVRRYEKGDSTAKAEMVRNGRGYVELLRGHIAKEDGILYPMGDRVLTDDDNRMLLKEFERIEQEVIGAGKHEHYLHMIEGMEREFGIEATGKH